MTADQIRSAYDALRVAYIEAYDAGDAAGLAGLFTEDAAFMPPEAPPVTGRESIASYYGAAFEQVTGRLRIMPAEIEPLGDRVYAYGTYAVTLTPKQGGDPFEVTGSYMNIGKPNPDGSLRIFRHIWNTPTPLQLPRP